MIRLLSASRKESHLLLLIEQTRFFIFKRVIQVFGNGDIWHHINGKRCSVVLTAELANIHTWLRIHKSHLF